MPKFDLDKLLELEQVDLLFAVRHKIKPLLLELKAARDCVLALREALETVQAEGNDYYVYKLYEPLRKYDEVTDDKP